MEKTVKNIDELNKKLLINDKRLEVALANSNLCMFEYYIDEKRIVCSPATMETFGTSHIIENAVESIIAAGIVHPNYVEAFKDTYRKISEGSPMEHLEFVQYRKDGSEMLVELTLTNVFDEKGRPVVAIGLMKDVTDRLLLERERLYKDMMLENSTNYCELNFTKNKIIGTENKFAMGLASSSSFDEVRNILAKTQIHPDDIDRYLELTSSRNIIASYKNGIQKIEVEYRNRSGAEYRWNRATLTMVKDTISGDLKGVMYVTDIHDTKISMERLIERAERDSLTGLYNKMTTEGLIKNALLSTIQGEKSVLMIIDVDDFKDVNDNLGHLYGDIVLTSLADMLKLLFRAGDIIGRIGGDEFFVFMKNFATDDEDIALNKAREICKAFKKTYREKDVSCSISASIGIAFFPAHGGDFEALYKNADTALYKAKENGKNCFAVFDGQTSINYKSSRTTIDNYHNLPQKSFKENRVEYLFKILYGSKDTQSAIRSVLELMTDYYNFDRGYIFEINGDTVSNTFEWCKEGVTPQIDNLQNIPIEVCATAFEHFYKSGMFILKSIYDLPENERAILEPQGIKSMFQFGIFDENKLVGFIGFDDCERERSPSAADIDEKATVCNLLATFISKHRTSEKAQKDFKVVSTLVDNLDSFTYVIDENTFEVLFLNQKTKDFVGEPESGSKCYKLFRGNDAQCEDCPVRGLNDHVHKYSLEVQNKKYNLWIETTASRIEWIDGKKTCLVNCIDISKYKK